MSYRIIARTRDGTESEVTIPGPLTLANVCGWMAAHTCGNVRDCRADLRSLSPSYTASARDGTFYRVEWRGKGRAL